MTFTENNNYELDGALFTSTSETDFLSFLNEREFNAEWIETSVSGIRIEPQSEESLLGMITEKAKQEALYYASAPHTGNLYLRDIAVPSLLERARVNGYALSDLSYDDFAEIITKCLQTAKSNDITKIRVQDGKIGAFMANSYRVVPTPEIYENTQMEVHKKFGGIFTGGTWTHSMVLANYDVSLPTTDYKILFKSKGMNFYDVKMMISVVTSDTGYSGVNIYPAAVGIMSDGKRYHLPILGDICMEHKGKASIDEYNANLALAFAQYDKSKDRLKELDTIQLNYPFNAFCNILKKAGIGKKEAADVLDNVAVTIGNDSSATAADLYFKACEISFNADRKDTVSLMTLSENISKILKFNDKVWLDFDRPVNCWKYSV